MTDAELEALLGAPESDRVERKESLSGERVKTRVGQAICAFANDYADHRAPGIVVIGQRDDGSATGAPVTDALIRELAQIRTSGLIVPIPSMRVERRMFRGTELAVVIVEPSSSPPVRYDGKTWIRTGSTRATATFEEEQRLAERRRWKLLPFDVQPLPHVDVSELDQEYFRTTYLPGALDPDVVAANHRDIAGQLLGLRMLDPSGAPTVLGILALGIDPQRWVPGAYVQFVRFDGVLLTDPIRDQKEITGRLAEVIRRTEDVLEANIATATRFVDRELEARRPEYPLTAFRQLVRNAVMHRSYESTNAPIRIHWFDDRVEIQNPGGPYGQVTRENFGTGVTDYRNPNVAAALRDLGFVQRFGQGIPQAQVELSRNGNPALEWEVENTHTLLRLRKAT